MTPSLRNINRYNREVDGYHSFVEWLDAPQHIYIGRNTARYSQRNIMDSKWANPFILCQNVGADREWLLEEILKSYEGYVRKSPFLMSSLAELKDKVLGCWCSPAPCHGDVLIKLYQEVHGNSDGVKSVGEKPENSDDGKSAPVEKTVKPPTEKKRKMMN